MKIIRLILLEYIFSFTLVVIVSGNNYYVSESGDDNNSGTSVNSPWKTISEVNLSTDKFIGGDSILFRRGDTFTGQINLKKSGTSSASIVIGAYSSGNKPKLSGAVSINNWQASSDSIYTTIVQSTVKNVFVDDKQMVLARFPNTGWLFTKTGNGNSGFYDDSLNQANGYWNNANIRIRSIKWAYEIRKVQSFKNQNVVFDRALDYTVNANCGYYFDNLLSELDVKNEWYYDAGTKQLYFYPPAATNPDLINVYGTIYDYGIKTDWNISNLVIRDISFKMYAVVGAWFGGTCNNITIDNCDFIDCNTGVEVDGNPASNILIDGNYFLNSNARGIYGYSLTNSTISNNIVKQTGLIPGYGTDGVNGAVGICVTGFPENNLITGNVVDSTGYIGIRCDGQNSTTKQNSVKNTMLTLADGGAIYCWGTSTLNSKIQSNYIEKVVGNTESCPDLHSLPMGIYLDDYSSYMKILDNTIAQANGYGIFIHNSNNNTITGNTTFDNSKGGLCFSEDLAGGDKNNTIDSNVLYSLNESQTPLSLMANGGLCSWGTFRNNYYCNPYNSIVVYYSDPSYVSHYFGFNHWKAYSGQDSNSKTCSVLTNRFKVTDTLGDELINNGTFNDNIDSWGKWPLSHSILWIPNGGLDSGCLQFTLDLSDPNTIGRVYTNYFTLETGSYYQLRLSIIGAKYSTMYVTTVSNNSYNFNTYYPIELKRSDYTTIFSVPQADNQFRFDFQIDTSASSINLDNVHLHKVDGAFEDPHDLLYLFSNPSNYAVRYDLQQAVFYDLDGNTIIGSIELQPWQSEVLLLGSGEYNFHPELKNLAKLELLPNPVAKGHELQIKLNDENTGDLIVKVYDSAGRLVLTNKANSSEGSIRIETNQLSRGLFVVCLTGAKKFTAEKLIVY